MSFNLNCSWFAPFQTFYIAEQVSHHPPISAFYVTNRREGFTVASSILAKSKFYGNSTSAILEGTGKVRQITTQVYSSSKNITRNLMISSHSLKYHTIHIGYSDTG